MAPVESDEEDLTRRERREQARASRKAAEEAAASSAARRRRMTQLGGAVAAVVVAIVVILIATSGGGKSTPAPKAGANPALVTQVQNEIGGIPQSGNVLGSPAAPVTLVYYGDLQCPFCAEFTNKALPGVIEKWVKPGKLKIEYRNLETATHEPETFRTQQSAALAAGAQDKLWYYIELFYKQQKEEGSGYVNEAFLQGIAQQVPGLSLPKWMSARSSSAYQTQLEKDAESASNNGFNGTPSFLLGKNGKLKKLTSSEYGSFSESSGFDRAIEKALAS
ncbi:MAG: DsbA family protein [Solirubrobacteraceae bacterium]